MSTGGQVNPEQEPPPTLSAFREASDIAGKRLRRSEAVQNHIHVAGVVILWSAVIGGLALAAIWAWHLATPDHLHFLGAEQLKDIQTILLAAIGSSFATQAGKQWMNPSDKPEDSSH